MDSQSVLQAAFGSDACNASEVEGLTQFVKHVQECGLRLAVITSGGTAVPLEKNAVRFLDNFSTGTRGASCAEMFLEHGQEKEQVENGNYAIIFLSRLQSKLPFSRSLNTSDLLEQIKVSSDSAVTITDEDIVKVWRRFHKSRNRMFQVTFNTVQEYLSKLRHICLTVNCMGKRVIFLLAAAVSDFYIPDHEMPTHKIQSSGGSLTLRFQQVPKCLGFLKAEWVPQAVVVSFKLETDETILVRKMKAAREKYLVDCVVGNILETRYEQVMVDSKSGTSKLLRPSNGDCIENVIVKFLINLHSEHLRK